MREHIGNTDLDIVVGVSLATEEAEVYRTLQQNLRAAQFASFTPALNRSNLLLEQHQGRADQLAPRDSIRAFVLRPKV